MDCKTNMTPDDSDVISDKAPTVTIHIAEPEIVLTGTSSVLSIIGAIIIFATYIFVPKEYNFTRKLLVYLTIADFITAVCNLTGVSRYVYVYGTSTDCTNGTGSTNGKDNTPENSLQDLCRVQSFFTTASNLFSFLWTIRHRLPSLCDVAVVSTMFFHLGEDYCYGTGVWCGLKCNGDKAELRRLMFLVHVGWQLPFYVISCFIYMHIIFFLVIGVYTAIVIHVL